MWHKPLQLKTGTGKIGLNMSKPKPENLERDVIDVYREDRQIGLAYQLRLPDI